MFFTSFLSLSATLIKTVPSLGIAIPDEIKALYNAELKSVSIPITSPVDFISGPKVVSTPTNFDIENTGALTANKSSWFPNPLLYPNSFNFLPAITFTAKFTKGTFVTLEINGTVLLALGLTSRTKTSLIEFKGF